MKTTPFLMQVYFKCIDELYLIILFEEKYLLD